MLLLDVTFLQQTGSSSSTIGRCCCDGISSAGTGAGRQARRGAGGRCGARARTLTAAANESPKKLVMLAVPAPPAGRGAAAAARRRRRSSTKQHTYEQHAARARRGAAARPPPHGGHHQMQQAGRAAQRSLGIASSSSSAPRRLASGRRLVRHRRHPPERRRPLLSVLRQGHPLTDRADPVQIHLRHRDALGPGVGAARHDLAPRVYDQGVSCEEEETENRGERKKRR